MGRTRDHHDQTPTPPLQSQGSTYDGISVQMEDIDLNKYPFCSLKELPHRSRPPDDVILVERITQISESAPLGIFAPPPCHDLHKLSFDIQGAVF